MIPAANAFPRVMKVATHGAVVLAGDNAAGAAFSPCEHYRWLLWRMWNPELPFWTFGMLNPSTATHERVDPTIARCISRAKAGGAGGLIVWNLFAWRATKPEAMKIVADPVGKANDRAILHAVQAGAINVAGWGAHGGHMGRDAKVLNLLASKSDAKLHALAFTEGGLPRHPLYLPLNLEPQPWQFGDGLEDI
jgi:hypothetical protein